MFHMCFSGIMTFGDMKTYIYLKSNSIQGVFIVGYTPKTHVQFKSHEISLIQVINFGC